MDFCYVLREFTPLNVCGFGFPLCLKKRATGNYCAVCANLCKHDGNEKQLQDDCSLYLSVCMCDGREIGGGCYVIFPET